MESEESVRKALDDVIHLPLNVKFEGKELGGHYHAGPYYPLFVLTNSDGEVIYRWTGYTTSTRFIGSLKTGLSDKVTIAQKIERNRYNPNNRDINFLAQYHSEIGEYMESNKYYRMASNNTGRFSKDYSFLIFQNYADAIWNDKQPFDSIYEAADAVINHPKALKDNIRKLAMMMSNLARRKDRTDDIAKYLQAGIDATSNTRNETVVQYHNLLLADYNLYITKDTIKAFNYHHLSLGPNWISDPAKYYSYGKWCFDRRINLEEAEKYVRLACNKASAGVFRGKHLSLLAEICYARGNKNEAIKQLNQAINNDPDNESYQKRLEQIRAD